jgi:CspA family cold shock protein
MAGEERHQDQQHRDDSDGEHEGTEPDEQLPGPALLGLGVAGHAPSLRGQAASEPARGCASRRLAFEPTSSETRRITVPTGKVKFYDKDKGFGFVSRDDGGDVFVPKTALPDGIEELKAGTRLEFGVAAGKKGEQALAVRILDAPPSLATARRPAEDLQVMVEDTIKLIELKVQPSLRRGKHPDRETGKKVAQILRAIATELES